MINTIKGLFKVTKMAIKLLLFKAFRISLVSLYMALSADDLVLKPNCSSAEIPDKQKHIISSHYELFCT
jgi:hypothetical protein